MSESATRLRHDLRTALNHVLGYGDMLLEDAEAAGPPERREALGQVRSRALELLGLVDAALGGAPENLAVAVAALRAAAEPLTARLLETITALEALSPERDAADLHRMATAVHLLRQVGPLDAGPTARAEPGGWELPPRSGRGAAVAAGSTDGPSARILVADDDPANRELLGRRLERERHQVTFAADGAQALALLETDEYDVVLLDMMMPGLSGYEVLQRMKAAPALRDTPVLMISADHEQASVGRCIALGADDYLPKPFDPVLLRARVGACFARALARRQELEFLRQVRRLTAFAASLEAGAPEAGLLGDLAARSDPLGGLARVLESAAGEMRAREQRLALEVRQLRIEIDEARKARAVAEIVESDYFHDLARRAAELRGAMP